MGLFDSIRRVVGGDGSAEDGADDDGSDADQSALVDTSGLDVPSLRERAAGVADEVAVLDFSLSSLSQFDAAIDEGYDEELATSAEPTTYATDTVRFGCYLGEVLCRAYGGEWTRDPDWGVTVTGPDGSTTVDVFAVAERSITTGSVFAAVADRAAAEVGLDGDASDGDETDDHAADDELSDTAVPAAESGDDTDADLSAVDGEPEGPGESPADESPTAATPATDEAADPDDATTSLIDEAEPDAPASTTEPGADGVSPDAVAPDAVEPTDTDDSGAETTAPDASLFADDSTPTAGGRDGGSDASPAPDGEPTASAADAPDGTTEDDADPTAGDGLRATYAEAADELVSFWGEYDLDYTPESLQRLDALVSSEWDDDRFEGAAFGDDDSFDDRVFTSVSTELGSYFGEVLVRDLDAEWSDETTTDSVVVEGVDGPLAIPVFKVAGTAIKQQPVFARSYDSLLSDLDATE